MKSLKKTRRVQVILVTVVALVLSTALIGYALQDGINYFRAPAQVAAELPNPNEVFKLGGLVLEGSRTPGENGQFSFVVTDCIEEIVVQYIGNESPPDLFKEGQGTVVTGKYVEGVFLATLILAKHDETYQPKEVTDALSEEGACNHPES